MCETFADAVVKFERLLEDSGYSRRILWVRKQDVILAPSRRMFVRTTALEKNREFVEKVFNEGIQKRRGVLFATACALPEATCCYVWVPRDDKDAEVHLIGRGLKLSAQTEESRWKGYPVTNRMKWLCLRLRNWNHQRFKDTVFES